MRTILYGRIKPVMVFFPPDTGGGGGAGGNGNGGGTATADPQQQQQQQQSQTSGAPADPFAGIDMDLLDDATRQQIETARAQFATVANQAQQSRDFQSRYDQAQAQIRELQQGQQQQQHQRPANEPVTLEEELYQEYRAAGIEEKQAQALAKLNNNIFSKFGTRLQGQIHQNLAPVISNVVDSNASSAYEQIQQNDRLGIFTNPELQPVAQRLWDKVSELSQQGQLVNVNVVQNLARIYWAEHCEGNGMPNTQTQTQFQPSHQSHSPAPMIPVINGQQQQQQTRFTYPGAGNHVRQPVNGSRNSNTMIDAETAAAIGATVKEWPVQPKAYRKAGPPPGGVTRGSY